MDGRKNLSLVNTPNTFASVPNTISKSPFFSTFQLIAASSAVSFSTCQHFCSILAVSHLQISTCPFLLSNCEVECQDIFKAFDLRVRSVLYRTIVPIFQPKKLHLYNSACTTHSACPTSEWGTASGLRESHRLCGDNSWSQPWKHEVVKERIYMQTPGEACELVSGKETDALQARG